MATKLDAMASLGGEMAPAASAKLPNVNTVGARSPVIVTVNSYVVPDPVMAVVNVVPESDVSWKSASVTPVTATSNVIVTTSVDSGKLPPLLTVDENTGVGGSYAIVKPLLAALTGEMEPLASAMAPTVMDSD